MAQNTIPNYLGNIKSLLITTKKKIKNAKEVSLKTNGAVMDIKSQGKLIMFLSQQRLHVVYMRTLTKTMPQSSNERRKLSLLIFVYHC